METFIMYIIGISLGACLIALLLLLIFLIITIYKELKG